MQHSWNFFIVYHHIQTSDQLIKKSLSLVGQPQSVSLRVRPAAVFPLDVYFLMDFSSSMEDDLVTLQSIAGDIGEPLKCVYVCTYVHVEEACMAGLYH